MHNRYSNDGKIDSDNFYMYAAYSYRRYTIINQHL